MSDDERRTVEVGTEVQIKEWIGTVAAVNDDLYDIEWDSFGGPFGSSVTRRVPADLFVIRAEGPR